MFKFLKRSKKANVPARGQGSEKARRLEKIRRDMEADKAAGRYPLADKVYVSEAVHRLIEADPSFLSEVSQFVMEFDLRGDKHFTARTSYGPMEIWEMRKQTSVYFSFEG